MIFFIMIRGNKFQRVRDGIGDWAAQTGDELTTGLPIQASANLITPERR